MIYLTLYLGFWVIILENKVYYLFTRVFYLINETSHKLLRFFEDRIRQNIIRINDIKEKINNGK